MLRSSIDNSGDLLRPPDEKQKLLSILGRPPRSPRQKNEIFESDVEILKMGSQKYLGISTDTVAEEISLGLYHEPETWAWMCVMSSVSDLAVSGCRPLGLVLATQWGRGLTQTHKKRFFKTVNQACRAANVPFLGGDTGHDRDSSFTSTIIGVSQEMPLRRTKILAGDYLYLAHDQKLGYGPLLSLSVLFGWAERPKIEKMFRPVPNWGRTLKFRSRIAASIDTSDGVVSSVATLASLNGLGFALEFSTDTLSPVVQNLCRRHKISPELLWMIDLGDLQSLFVVKPKQRAFFDHQKGVTCIGRLTQQKSYALKSGLVFDRLPLQKILESGKSLANYRNLFVDLNRQFCNGVAKE